MILFIKHIDIEGPETLGKRLEERGYELGVCNLHSGDRLPGNVQGLEAVVSLGGPMNVYQEKEYPFLASENIFLQQVAVGRVPFLGICLGSQLLSKAVGGKVERSPAAEIGWFNIKLTEAGSHDPLFSGLPEVMEVFQWHGDMCVPPQGGEGQGAVILATAERCPVQAFRYGVNAYGLQFHAEITDKSIDEWSQEYAPEKNAERNAMLKRYQEIREDFHLYGCRLVDNFVRIIKGNRALSL